MRGDPDHLWNTTEKQEVYDLLQAEEEIGEHKGWHYVGDQVKAPGVPTVAQIGSDGQWVLTFAGYDPEVPTTLLRMAQSTLGVPADVSVSEASDEDLPGWIAPIS
ncbi:hypothetical protein diail_3812 [Diaporthe ilicicola]|nr:hypothetical protein diail_3812 [Diaporthe ilicicola]